MKKIFALLLLSALLTAAILAQPKVVEVEDDDEEIEEEKEEGEVFILIRRTFLNDSFAEGIPMHVRLTVFNAGTKDATNVIVNDNYPKSFGGVITKQFALISSKQNFTEEYVVTPQEAGKVIVGRVSYTYGENNQHSGAGDLGWHILVEDSRSYFRRTDPHYMEWGIFGTASAFVVGLPMFIWFSLRKH